MKLNEKLISLKELYCMKCGSFLNGRIMLSKESKNICKKCFDKNLGGKGCIRNIPLEKIIELLEIPCKYSSKGCEEVLNHTEISSHESKCQYRPVRCPMLDCQMVSFNELEEHLCFKHTNNLIESGDLTFEIDIDTNVPNKIIKLLLWKRFLFLLGLSILENDIMVTVQCMTETELRLNYLLNEITAENFTSKCNIKNEIKNYHEDKDSLKICIANEKRISPLMKIKLIIFSGDEILQVDSFLLKQLECPICLEAMLPPIYIICRSAHTVCSNCRIKLSTCPICNGDTLEGILYRSKSVKEFSYRPFSPSIRNYHLEQVSKNICHYCSFRSKGCMFIANGVDIIKHQETCTFRETVCPYQTQGDDCSFTGLYSDLVKHLEETHSAKDKLTVSFSPLMTPDEDESWENFVEDQIESGHFRCLVCFDHIFIINYKYTSCSATCTKILFRCWSVLEKNKENFKLEVTTNGFLNEIVASTVLRKEDEETSFETLEIPVSFLECSDDTPEKDTWLSIKISKMKV